jgi:modification target Cys-rich repeat protein
MCGVEVWRGGLGGTSVPIFLLQLNKIRNFHAAWPAPRGPKIQQHHFPRAAAKFTVPPSMPFTANSGAGSESRINRITGSPRCRCSGTCVWSCSSILGCGPSYCYR